MSIKQDAEIKKHIDTLINSNKVIVFGKSWCGFTQSARKVLEECNANYRFFDLETEPKSKDCFKQYQTVLGQMTGKGNLVPKVFVNKECIGGGDEVCDEHKSGKLQLRLATMCETTKNDVAIKCNIESLIKQNKAIIFGKAWCNFTKKAIQTFEEAGLKSSDFKFFDIEKEEDAQGCTKHWQKVLGSMTNNGGTVPVVFIKNHYIGGGDDVREAFDDGSFFEQLEAAGLKPKHKNKNPTGANMGKNTHTNKGQYKQDHGYAHDSNHTGKQSHAKVHQGKHGNQAQSKAMRG